jgi:DNA-binding SARP family transcriptional activator/Tfp pilus assembly protein PilF
VQIQVLGPLRAWRDGVELELGALGQRSVLGLLALAAGQPVPIAELVDSLWPYGPPARAANVVQTYVSRLRRILEQDRPHRGPSDALPLAAGGYALRLPTEQVDLWLFRQLVGRADQARDAGDLPAAAELLGRAVRLWRGEPLAGIPVLAGHPRAVALIGERNAALAHYAQAMIQAGTPADALPILAQAAATQPLDEAAQARLIRVLHATGQRAAAVEHFTETQRRLAAELGVDPGPELRSVHAELLTDPPPGAAPLARRPAQLPADVPGFVGRAEQLAQLDALVSTAGTAPAIAAISGPAGVGKTTLAAHWAHRARERFPDGQLYVNLRGFDPGQRMEPAEAIRQFLDALGVPAERVPADQDARAGLYRSMLAGRRMLILLDNAGDAAQVRPLLPGAPGCAVVVTGRATLAGLVAAHGARPVALDLLTTAEARELLVARLGGDRTGAEPGAVAEIIVGCSRLPLALAIAAARAATERHASLAKLAAELRDTRISALSAGDPQTDLRTVFSWSYAALRPATARLFRLLGVHAGPSITVPAAASLAARPAAEVRRMLIELTLASLVTEQPAGRYGFHDLLRSYAAELARETDATAETRAASTRILDHYLHSADAADQAMEGTSQHLRITLRSPQPGVVPERPATAAAALSWFAAERPALLAAIAAAPAGFDRHIWQLAWAMRIYLNRQGHWDDLASTATAALAAAERAGEPAEQVRAHRALARAFAARDAPEPAQAHLEAALELAIGAGDETGQSSCHANLVPLLVRLGRHEAALGHARRYLELERRAGRPAGIAAALNHLGWAHTHAGEPDRARRYCEEALALLEHVGKPSDRAATLDSLGLAHRRLGNTAEAVDYFRRSIETFREIGDIGAEALTLVGLGDTLDEAGDRAGARGCWLRALEIMTQLRHPEADQLRAKLAGQAAALRP